MRAARRKFMLSEGASSLITGLRAYWKLNEASGTRASEVNSLTLTDNNTVGSAAGKIGNAAQFVAASSEYLSHADDALFSFTASYTFSLWVYLNSAPGAGTQFCLIGKDDGAGREYQIVRDADADSWRLYHFGSGGLKIAEKTVVAATSTWYHILADYDSDTQVASIAVNNGAAGTVASATALTDTTSIFALGATSTPSAYLDGRLDEVGLWARVLTSNERAQLYNGGAGVTYPAFV